MSKVKIIQSAKSAFENLQFVSKQYCKTITAWIFSGAGNEEPVYTDCQPRLHGSDDAIPAHPRLPSFEYRFRNSLFNHLDYSS